jgi:hypothetical protein
MKIQLFYHLNISAAEYSLMQIMVEEYIHTNDQYLFIKHLTKSKKLKN